MTSSSGFTALGGDSTTIQSLEPLDGLCQAAVLETVLLKKFEDLGSKFDGPIKGGIATAHVGADRDKIGRLLVEREHLDELTG